MRLDDRSCSRHFTASLTRKAARRRATSDASRRLSAARASSFLTSRSAMRKVAIKAGGTGVKPDASQTASRDADDSNDQAISFVAPSSGKTNVTPDWEADRSTAVKTAPTAFVTTISSPPHGRTSRQAAHRHRRPCGVPCRHTAHRQVHRRDRWPWRQASKRARQASQPSARDTYGRPP